MTHAHALITAQKALMAREGRTAEARRARDEAVRAAKRDGLSLRQIATNTGLSHQAVAKIVAGGHAATS